MSIPVVDANSITSGGVANPMTALHTCSGSNRLLVVIASVVDNPAPSCTAMTYNSVAMTELAAYNSLFNDGVIQIRTQLFYLVAPATGPNTISATWSNASAERSIIGVSFTNAEQTPTFGTPATGNGTTQDASVTVSGASGELIIASAAGGGITIKQNVGMYLQNKAEGINGGSSHIAAIAFSAASALCGFRVPNNGYGLKWAAAGVSIKGLADPAQLILG